MFEMHNKNILHRDLKSDNILMSSDGQIKITDLGFAKPLTQEEIKAKTMTVGTYHWKSPELFTEGVRYSREVDVWAFGCYAYELATGNPLNWHIRQKAALIKQVIGSDAPKIPERWSDAYRDFVRVCLRRNPSERFNFS